LKTAPDIARRLGQAKFRPNFSDGCLFEQPASRLAFAADPGETAGSDLADRCEGLDAEAIWHPVLTLEICAPAAGRQIAIEALCEQDEGLGYPGPQCIRRASARRSVTSADSGVGSCGGLVSPHSTAMIQKNNAELAAGAVTSEGVL